MVLSNEPQEPLEYHVGTAAERHPVVHCSISFCGMRWHPDRPGSFGPTPEPLPDRFEIRKPCSHDRATGHVSDDDLWEHLVMCLNEVQRKGYLVGLREVAKLGSDCVSAGHVALISHIGTDAGVDDAIRASYQADGDDGLITGWVVLASVSSFDADGTDRSGVHRMFPDGSLPWVQALGIVEAGRIAMHKAYANGAD